MKPTTVRPDIMHRLADFPGGHAGASLKRLPSGADVVGKLAISPADTPGPH